MTEAMPAPTISMGAAPRAYPGRKVVYWFVGLTILLGIATWYIPPLFIVGMLKKRPAKLERAFHDVGAALLAYRADHGEFPPETGLYYYWDSRKLLEKTGAIHLPTYMVNVLTTPVAYYDPWIAADPYAMPVQNSPLAYVNLGDRTVLWSASSNLRYEIKAFQMRDMAEPELREYLAQRTWDPTNGTKSKGDEWRIVE